jgi:UrcA family protein
MDHSKSVAGAATVLLACLFAVPAAFAGEPDPQVRIEDIKFQDLNLDNTAGVETLYKRIHAAARRVCAVSGQSRDTGSWPDDAVSATAKCSKKAQARAIGEMNLPALTAFAVNR